MVSALLIVSYDQGGFSMKYTRLRKLPASFRRLTGLTVTKFEQLLNQLNPIFEAAENNRLNRPNRQRAIGGGRSYGLSLEDQLLMCLMYYRLYVTQELLAVLFDLDKSNVSRRINYLQPLLAQVFAIPSRKISLKDANTSETQLIQIFVDATEQVIQRPGKGQRRYYSGKKKRHTLKNQIETDTKGQILTVSRSYQGRVHDKKIYDKTRSYPDQKNVGKIGDLGYIGIPKMTTPFKKPKGKSLTKEQKAANRELAKVRIVVEHSIRKMKIFKILQDRYRNPLNKHSLIFKNIAGLANMMMA